MSWYLASVFNPKKSNSNLWQAPASFEAIATVLKESRIPTSGLFAADGEKQMLSWMDRLWLKPDGMTMPRSAMPVRYRDPKLIHVASTIRELPPLLGPI